MLEIVLSNQLYNNIQCKLYMAVNCAILSYYAASSGNFLPTFRDNLSVISYQPQGSWTLRPVRNYDYPQRNNPVECRSQLLRGGNLKSHIIQGCSYASYFIEW